MSRFSIASSSFIAALLGATSLLAQQNNVGQPSAGPGAAAGQTVQVPIMSPNAAVQAGVAQVVPQAPFEPLDARESQYLDQVLSVWEQRTAMVTRFQCEFTRWEYDPGRHPTAPVTIASGVIKFSKPDKGMFRVDDMQSVADKSPNPQYQVNPRRPHGEYWICDGNWVHNMDRNEKKAIRTELPPEMRGNQIHLSPLPFLFGVKAAEIKQRYWVRTIQPPQGNNDVWIEAWPKRPDDAGNYSRVQVVLDRADVLPKAMFVFLPHWSPEKKHREIYEFKNRDLMDGILDKVKEKIFMQEFISTKLDADWQVLEEPWIPQQADQPQAAIQPGAGNPAFGQQPGVGQPPLNQPGNNPPGRVASPAGGATIR